jgi:hypothetical protein
MNDEHRPYRVWWDDEAGVARAEWEQGADCGLEVAREIDAQVVALGHGKVPLLVNIRNIGSIDRAAREYFMHSATHYTAVALLAGSAATRMMANFFLGLSRGENRASRGLTRSSPCSPASLPATSTLGGSDSPTTRTWTP